MSYGATMDSAGTLYIAGSSSAVPRAGRANSGYLLQTGGCAIAIDFGSGVFSRLRQRIEPAILDALIISHMHADHFFDIVPLRYALRYEMKRPHPLPVYLPPGGIRVAQTIGRPLKETQDFYSGVLDLHEYSPDRPLHVGACTVRFAPTVHYVPAFAMRVETPQGVLGYSADTAPCNEVPELVKDADVFLCEASLGANGKEQGERGHLNAYEAGEMAQRAGVKHLVITHYGASAAPRALHEAAAKTYSGKITVADDGEELRLNDHRPG
jgi:ribonuclease BN (tRNA processing enzyme)